MAAVLRVKQVAKRPYPYERSNNNLADNYFVNVRIRHYCALITMKPSGLVTMADEADDIFWTHDVLEHRIHDITDDELLRLGKLAEQYAWGVFAGSHEELVQETVFRALDGRRRWSKEIDFGKFLFRTMRSILTDQNNSWQTKNVEPDSESDVYMQASSDANNPLNVAHAKELMQEIEQLFADDEAALMILVCRGQEDTPEEIREALELNETQYATALRRIRRKLNAHFGGRGATL